MSVEATKPRDPYERHRARVAHLRVRAQVDDQWHRPTNPEPDPDQQR